MLAPISDAEIARMVQIKEEAFDEEGYFNPGWKEQFVGAPEPAPGNIPVDQYLIRDGEVLYPPVVLRHGFEVMQDKFLSFAGEFSQLLNSMSNMSQVRQNPYPYSPLALRRILSAYMFRLESYELTQILAHM